MDILSAIKSRKSIRGYLSELVPRELISKILEVSLAAPSGSNTQPWEFTVVCGEVLENIKRDNIEKLLAGTVVNSRSNGYIGIHRQRKVELAKDIFALMDIEREDREKRLEWLLRGFRFFDAPAAVIIAADKSLEGSWSMFDIGAVAQTICLAAMNYGVATCIEEQGVVFQDVIRKHTGIPEDKEVIIGIALGFPDPNYSANKLKSRRESLDVITNWLGF